MKQVSALIALLVTVFAQTTFRPDDFSPYSGIIDKFLAGSDQWYLAAAGSNGVPPPERYCVRINITELTSPNECIYNTLNHTVHSARTFKILGTDELNKTKILTAGPVLSYTREEQYRHVLFRTESVFSLVCWNRHSHQLVRFQYVVMLPDDYTGVQPYLILIGIEVRHPHPHIQVALLTWGKQPAADVMTVINKYNNIHWRYFLEYDELLPAMEIKCATGYNERNKKDPLQIAKTASTVPYKKYEDINTAGLLESQYKFTTYCPGFFGGRK